MSRNPFKAEPGSDRSMLNRLALRVRNLERRLPASTGGASAYAGTDIGATTFIPANTSVAPDWDLIGVDDGGVFTEGAGTTPWNVTVAGQYQILLAIEPDVAWPAEATKTIELVPDGHAAFAISEGGMFDADGSSRTAVLTGFCITGALPAAVEIRVFNNTSSDITIVGPHVVAIINRLGPQVP